MFLYEVILNACEDTILYKQVMQNDAVVSVFRSHSEYQNADVTFLH